VPCYHPDYLQRKQAVIIAIPSRTEMEQDNAVYVERYLVVRSRKTVPKDTLQYVPFFVLAQM
jgi:hypothetical protein